MRNHPKTALLLVVVILSAAIIAMALAIAPWSDRFLSKKDDAMRARSSATAASPLAELSMR
jgi:hypothetical protein